MLQTKVLRIITVLILLFLLVAGVFRLHTESNLLDSSLDALLPTSVEKINDYDHFRTAVGHELVYLLTSDNADKTKKSLDTLNQHLIKYPQLKVVSSQNKKEISKFYFEHRYAYASFPYPLNNDEEKDNAKNKLITDIENSLYSPFGGFSSFELEYDPFMTMRRIIGEQVDNFKIDNEGLLYIEYNKQNYYLIRAIINSEFDNSNRELLARDSAELKDQFATEGVNLLYTGEVFFADAATKASVDDMTRIGVISTIVLVIMLVLVYRGFSTLLITLCVLSISLGAGFLAVIVCFGNIHAMALAMGSCLIGICVDYCIHVFTAKGKITNGNEIRKALKIPLLFSLITSLLAYLSLTMTNLLVLKELALFALVALTITFLLVYAFIADLTVKVNPSYVIAKFLLFCISKINKYVVSFIIIITLIGGALSLYLVNVDDDVAHMQEKNTSLTTMNNLIQKIISGYEHVGYYIVVGNSTETALQHCEDLKHSLSDNELKNIFLPCKLIPSKKQQTKNMQDYIEMYPILAEKFAKENLALNPAAIPKILPTFNYDSYPNPIDGFFGKESILIRVNVNDDKLINKLNNYSFVVKLDQREQWSKAFASYRKELSVALLIAFGLAIISVLGLLKKSTISRFVLPLLGGASLGLIGCVIFANGYFNLFTTLAFFMLLGLGADYCIFMHSINAKNINQSMQSVAVACLTTEASFGSLAFSSTAVMSSFGTVIFLGILGTSLFAMLIRISFNKSDFYDIS